jgi:hypothetical protein
MGTLEILSIVIYSLGALNIIPISIVLFTPIVLYALYGRKKRKEISQYPCE